MLALLTCFGITLFGSDASLFRDEDTGFVMQIPAEMKRTWNLSHSENGMELIVFQSEDDEERFFVIALGKIPLTDFLGQGSEGLYPMVFEQVQEMICDLQEDEGAFSLEILPSLADTEYGATRMRICIQDEEEEEEGMAIDVHTFLVDTYSILVATGVYSCEERDLDQFTFDVLSSVRFIDEEQE